MTDAELIKTSIGADYLEKRKTYSCDTLLDYLSSLLKTRAINPQNYEWQMRYTQEIEATKLILERQTKGK